MSTANPSNPPASSNLSLENFAFLRQYVYRESGIALGDDKLYLINSRLTPVLQDQHLASLNDLCVRLRTAPTEELRRKVVESMTTHETLFFRDPAVFEALQAELLPALMKARQEANTLRIWSAACSSGQEPYSLAMALLEAGVGNWKIEIVGTDLSARILERAAAGRFLQIEVNRGLPARLLVKYFTRAGADWQLKDEVRRMVRFIPVDLRRTTRGLGLFDLVLCRNVLIYFDDADRKRVLAGIASVLRPGGFLVLGASETTFSMDDHFRRKPMGKAMFYQVPVTEAKA